MIKTFVELFYPGSFVSETQTIQIDVKREDFDVTSLTNGVFAYRFFDITEVETTEGEILKGPRKNISGMYYPQGVLKTADDFDAKKDRILLSNMKSNNWSTVVQTRLGNIQPFIINKDKIVL